VLFQTIPKHDAVKQKEMGLTCTQRLSDGNKKARRKIAEKQHAINFKRGTIRFSGSGSVCSTASVAELYFRVFQKFTHNS
jgi:hypothetical protein